MRLKNITCLVFALFLIQTRAANHTDDSSDGTNDTVDRITRAGRIAAKYGNRGGMVRFCFDEEICKNVIQLKLFKLVERTSGGSVVQKSENFANSDYEWTAPQVETVNGTERIRVEMKSNVSVGSPNLDQNAEFEFHSFVYKTNGTAINGNQTLDIPKNSLKFSIKVKNWPWKSTDNVLTFGVALLSKTKRGGPGRKSPLRKKGRGRKGKVSRFELGDGSFLDSPEQCECDGKAVELKETLTEDIGNKGVMMSWTFPHFENAVYYDPVLGSTSSEEAQSDDNDDDSSSGSSSPASMPIWTSSLLWTLSIFHFFARIQ